MVGVILQYSFGKAPVLGYINIDPTLSTSKLFTVSVICKSIWRNLKSQLYKVELQELNEYVFGIDLS